MKRSRILVTGATGNTGGSAIQSLLNSGRALRAFVRKDDSRADKVRAAGVEVVVGDLLDIDSVRAALEDVHAAYFVYPLSPQILGGAVSFAQAAKEAGVNAIVNISQATARRDSKSDAAQSHWLAEQAFDWSGVPVTHLRPTLFAEWLLYPFSWENSAKDTLSLPSGDGRFAPIASEDQGRVAAAILVDAAQHAGQTYHLFGPVELDRNDMAAAISEALERMIRYTAIDLTEFSNRLKKMPDYSSPFFMQHIGAIAVDAQNGITSGTNDTVERLTGTAPMSVQQFVQKNRPGFKPTELPQTVR